MVDKAKCKAKSSDGYIEASLHHLNGQFRVQIRDIEKPGIFVDSLEALRNGLYNAAKSLKT